MSMMIKMTKQIESVQISKDITYLLRAIKGVQLIRCPI